MQSTVPIYVMMAGEAWADQSDITAYKDDKSQCNACRVNPQW